VQGVVRSFDPDSGEGVVVRDTDRLDIVLAPDALKGSLFTSLRQGQRVNFDLDSEGRASRVRSGAEKDLGLPDQVQI
jgi:CspA family cold shock protein